MRMVAPLRAFGVTAAVAAVAIVGVSAIGSADAPALGGPAVDACRDLGGNIQAGTICHVTADTDAYSIDMRFGVDYPDGRAVADYVHQLHRTFVAAAEAPGAKNLPYQMFVNVEEFKSGQPLRVVPSLGQRFPGAQAYGEPWQGTESMALKIFTRLDVDSVVPRSRYKTFTFDHNKNRALSFGDLFAPDSKPLDAIYPYAAADVERQQLARHYKLPPKDGLDPAFYQNFAITDDALIIFTDTGRLVPDESGDIVITIPRNGIPPLQI
ncbi:RsiV family protein [Mycolicibacter sinensis]|nr:RsiV family protein [Mycolicibacter sinensis]